MAAWLVTKLVMVCRVAVIFRRSAEVCDELSFPRHASVSLGRQQ